MVLLHVSYFIGSPSNAFGFGETVVKMDNAPRNVEEVVLLRSKIVETSKRSDKGFPENGTISIVTWTELGK